MGLEFMSLLFRFDICGGFDIFGFIWCFKFAGDRLLGLCLCSLGFESSRVFVFYRFVGFDFTCSLLSFS